MLGFYSILFKLLTTESFIEILFAQFNMFVNSKLSFFDTDRMKIDEFDLVVNMYNSYIKELESRNV